MSMVFENICIIFIVMLKMSCSYSNDALNIGMHTRKRELSLLIESNSTNKRHTTYVTLNKLILLSTILF